jgi:hypothetical protein
VVDFPGILWTCVVLFDQLLVRITQLEEARNFVKEGLLRDRVAPSDLVAAKFLSKLDSTTIGGILNQSKQLSELCVIDTTLATADVI